MARHQWRSWNTLGNWGISPTSGSVTTAGTIPSATNNQLVFDTTVTGFTSLTSTNNITGLILSTITINDASSAGAFAIGGTTITLTSGITSSATNGGTGATLSFGTTGITLNGPESFTSNSGLLTVSAKVANGGNLLTVAGAGSVSLTGIVSGTGGITESGSGTLTLSGVNTFSGGLTINSGTVIAGVSNSGTTSGAAGPSGDAITLGSSIGGSASLLAGTFTVSNPINLGTSALGTLTIGDSAGSIATFSGAIGLDGDAVTFASTGTGTTTVSGAISGSGNVTINDATTASTVLSGPSTFSGSVTLDSGTVIASNATAAGSSGNTITLGSSTGGSATLLVSVTLANPINLGTGAVGSLTIANNAGSTVATISGAIGLNGDSVTFASTGTASTTLSGGISGSGNVTITNSSSAKTVISTTAINNAGTITNNGPGTGTTTISIGIGSNVTGVIENTASSQLTLSAANTFTGGLTIDSGTVLASNATAAGLSGNITLGSSTGGSASLLASVNLANPLNLGIGALGTLTIGNNGGTTTGTFSGAINLNGDSLTVTATGTTGSTTVTGGIAGTGNVTITDDATTTGAITISTNNVNNVGTITNQGTGTGVTTISTTIGPFVTGVIQNSANSQLTLSAANAFGGLTIDSGTVLAKTQNLSAGGGIITLGSSTGSSASLLLGSGTPNINNPITLGTNAVGTLTLGNNAGTTGGTFSGAISLNGNALTIAAAGTTGFTTVTGAISGTGNVNITDNATTGAITISSHGINNVGMVTNDGTGTGTVTISAVIGSNVTGVIQNSTGSELVLSGANTFGGGLTIDSGTVDAAISNATTVSGAAGPSANPITLGSPSGGPASLLADSFTVSNAINLGSNALSTLTIGNDDSATAAVFSGAISLNGDSLIITATGTGSTSVSGGITGIGNIAITDNGTTATTVIKTNAINNTGTITNLGNGSGATTISAGIGSNVAAVIQNSSTSQLTLSGTNTYVGPTTVEAGTLEFGKEVSLYDNNSASWTATSLIVDSGTTAVFAVGGSGQFTAANIATLSALGTATGGFESGSFLGFDTTSGNFSYSNPITNPNGGSNVLGLIKLGSNSLTLSGNETYSGSTNVLAGTLEFSSEAAFYDDNTTNWTAVNVVVESGATAAFAVGGPGQFTASDIAILSSLGTTNGGFENGSLLGIDTTSGSFTLANSIVNPNGGSNALGLAKLGSNTLTLSGNNTYTGATDIVDGGLQVSGSGTLGAPNNALVFAPVASTSATLDFNNVAQSYQVASLSSSAPAPP